MFCKKCGTRISNDAVACVKCGVATDNFNEATKKKNSEGLIAAGYICGAISLLFLPPAFGLAETVIGIINLTNTSKQVNNKQVNNKQDVLCN